MTSNEYYGKLNQRFDRRAADLRRLGFKYQVVPGLNVAVFVATKWGKTMAIAAGTVLNASRFVWRDELDRAERFVS